jgi:serine/threonine protein kinase
MVSSPLFCTHCGAANQAQAAFCYACGQAIQAPVNVFTSNSSGPLRIGALLKQRYQIMEQIGAGGFGAVYKAEDVDLGRRLVAVKEMSQQGLHQREIDESVEAFKHEALMLAGLRHEHLPRIYDHFEENERWYLVMDYIEGETLEEHFKKSRDGSLPLVMAMRIALQLCEVLDYLHTRQPPIIFRDLKPSNVILTPEGDVFLVDFGIARHFKPGQAKDTIAFGSPGYAAPEQYGKAQTTPRADIYSLGTILHQMLSGADPSLSPFHFAPLTGVDPALGQLVSQMLEIDEKKRPLSIAKVMQTLRYIQEHPAPPVPAPPRAGQLLPAASSLLYLPALPQVHALHTPLLVHEHHYGIVRAVAWSPDSSHAASATDAIVRVWDAHSGQNIVSYREHMGVIRHMAWSPVDTRIASVSEENKIRVWDAYGGNTITVYLSDPKLHLSRNTIYVLAWSRDGRYLAVGGSQYLSILDTNEGRVSAKMRSRFMGSYISLSWAPDGRSLAAAHGNKVLIWRPERKPKTIYYSYNAQVNAVAWSPDGVYLASGGHDRMVHVWNVQNDTFIGVYQNQIRPVSALAWSPDSRRIVSASLAANINVWDAMTGQTLVSYYAHAGDVLALAWSPDGRSILSGGTDCKVRVWSAP